jgi:hypothetical protein
MGHLTPAVRHNMVPWLLPRGGQDGRSSAGRKPGARRSGDRDPPRETWRHPSRRSVRSQPGAYALASPMARQMPSRRGNRHYRKRIGYRFLIVRPFAQHQLVEPVPFSARSSSSIPAWRRSSSSRSASAGSTAARTAARRSASIRSASRHSASPLLDLQPVCLASMRSCGRWLQCFRSSSPS